MRFREIEELIEGETNRPKCEFCGISYGRIVDKFDAIRMRKDVKCDAHPKCKMKARFRVEYTDGRIENHFTIKTIKAPGNPSYDVLTAILSGKNTTSERYGIKSIGRYKPNGEYSIAEPKFDNEWLRGNSPGLLPWKECEHCGKSTTPGNYAKWHGDKCKQSPGYVAPEKTIKKRKKEQRKARYEVEFTDGRIEYHRSFTTIKAPGNPSGNTLSSIVSGNMITSERYGIKSIGKLQPNGEYEIAKPKRGFSKRGHPIGSELPSMDCEHCGKTNIKVTNYAVWHGDRCRENPNYVPREKNQPQRRNVSKYKAYFVDGSYKEFNALYEMSEYTGVPQKELGGIVSGDVDGGKYGIIFIEKV